MKKTYIVFTDGSSSYFSGSGGWAFIAFDLDKGKGQPIEDAEYCQSGGAICTTNNIMELTAIINAARAVPDNSRIIIVTDSQYCIMVLDHRDKTFPKNMEYILQFREVVETKHLDYSFKWVKGHNGNRYNEYVDKLATEENERARINDLAEFGFM